jgi:hypothetical protein
MSTPRLLRGSAMSLNFSPCRASTLIEDIDGRDLEIHEARAW